MTAKEVVPGRDRSGLAYPASGHTVPGFVCDFRSTLSVVEVHPSARRHGALDEDIRHAIDHALAIEDVGEDPDRWLVIGPDRAGNLLEVVVLVTIEGAQLAIHAMRMRAKFRRLIQP